MSGEWKLRNPFRPGAGALPPVLSGRDRELSIAHELLDSLEGGGPAPRGLLFFGPRGNGKTTLLARIAEDARSRGIRVENLAARAFGGERTLARHLQEKAGLAAPRIPGPRTRFGISVGAAAPAEDLPELFRAWVGANALPLVILLDEAHTVEPEAGRVFFSAVQEATTRSPPFLLVLAGTPDAPRRLGRVGTFTERAFRRVPVGRLERAATLRALVEPAKDAGRPLHEEAASLLAGESQDYPYFIQLLGSAAWRATESADSAISAEAAHRGAIEARVEIELFFTERYGEAREREIDDALGPLAALFAERGGQLTDGELQALLRNLTRREFIEGGRQQLLQTLSDLGVVWETPPAGWEMGIPSFADFLLAHHSPQGDA